MRDGSLEQLIEFEKLKEIGACDVIFEMYKQSRDKNFKKDAIKFLFKNVYIPAIEFRVLNMGDRSYKTKKHLYLLFRNQGIHKCGELLIQHFGDSIFPETLLEMCHIIDTGEIWCICGIRCGYLDAYLRAIEKGYELAHFHIGSFYLFQNEFDLAFSHWKKHFTKNPEDHILKKMPLYMLEYFADRNNVKCAYEIIRRDTTRENILKYGALFIDSDWDRSHVDTEITHKLDLESNNKAWTLLAPFFVLTDRKYRYDRLLKKQNINLTEYDICQWYPVAGFKLKFYPKAVAKSLKTYVCCMHRKNILPKDIVKLIAMYILSPGPIEDWTSRNKSWFNIF